MKNLQHLEMSPTITKYIDTKIETFELKNQSVMLSVIKLSIRKQSNIIHQKKENNLTLEKTNKDVIIFFQVYL